MIPELNRIYQGDTLAIIKTWPDDFVHCVVTSPPYWGLRDYGVAGQHGLEKTPEEYIAKMVEVFSEVRRVLRDDGTLWLNIGDSYNGSGKGPTGFNGIGNQEERQGFTTSKAKDRTVTRWGGGNNRAPGYKPKDLIGIPWMLAFALRADGWYLRSDIIWSKPNPMPESVTDRPTKAHEYIFLLSKSERYYYDSESIKEPATYDPGHAIPDGGDTGEGSHNTIDFSKRSRAFFKNAQEYKGKHRKELPEGQTNLRAKRDKQRGHSRCHDGFNDRWDLMSREEQMSFARNKRTVWEIATAPFKEAHFATFPEKLIKPCIIAGSMGGGHRA